MEDATVGPLLLPLHNWWRDFPSVSRRSSRSRDLGVSCAVRRTKKGLGCETGFAQFLGMGIGPRRGQGWQI